MATAIEELNQKLAEGGPWRWRIGRGPPQRVDSRTDHEKAFAGGTLEGDFAGGTFEGAFPAEEIEVMKEAMEKASA